MIHANEQANREQAVRTVVREVLAQLGKQPLASTNGSSRTGDWGVFGTVDAAVAAANDGFEKLKAASMADRAKAVECVRQICTEQAEELGRLEMEETKIGRLDHKIEKLQIIKLVRFDLLFEFHETMADAVAALHEMTEAKQTDGERSG